MSKITPFLWFNTNIENVINYYSSIFDSVVVHSKNYVGPATDANRMMMSASIEIAGQKIMALNGGPHFEFTPAFSFYIECENQEEVDNLWNKLTAEGKPSRCGWLLDKYGLSWQIIPKTLGKLVFGGPAENSQRAMAAMMKMEKIIIADLEKAYNGE